MNPLIPVGAFAAWTLATGVAAMNYGEHRERQKHDEIELAIQKTQDKTLELTGDAIAKIEVKHETINNKVQREIRTHTIYADCKHTPDGLRLLNESLENRSEPVDKSKLSGPDKTGG